ncbi:MAG: radical SAM protein [Candidatus Norongarragalinales archaeon]
MLVVPNVPAGWDWGTLPEPPLGVAWVAAYLKDEHEVAVIDDYLEKNSRSELLRKIRSFSPDAVGFSTTTFTECEAESIAADVKKAAPETQIFFGGPHASLFPQKVLECSSVDAVVIGEGEVTCAEYLSALAAGKPLEGVKGIAFKKNNEEGKVRVNEPRPYMNNLDELRFPARELLKIREYPEYKMSVSLKTPSTTMCTSRGCPYNCLYCSSPTIWGRSWRGMSGKRVTDEIEFLTEKYGVKSIKFHEDHFTFNKQRVLDICREIRERGIEIEWQCESRVNNIDAERLKAMRDAGCKIVWYGIESGTQKILDFYRKGTTLEQVKNAVRLTNEAGIEAMGSFILGAPIETREEMEETIRFGLALELKEVYFNVLLAIPGTDLYDFVVKNNFVHKYVVGGMAEVAGTVPRDEVVRLRNAAQKQVIKRKIRRNWFSLLKYFVRHPKQLFSRRALRTLEFLRTKQ